MKYKNQHFVTESYLRAWRDPLTPNGAFVWTVSKRDHTIHRASPKKLFSEDDFYTIYDSVGNRILTLEHELEVVEDKFILLRKDKLQNHQPLTPDDRKTITLFLSSMFVRTKRQKEEDKIIWQEYIKYIETLPKELSAQIKQTKEYQDVQNLHINQPMPFHLFSFVNMAFTPLYLMNCAIYEVNTNPGLITSDNPCLWIDPTLQDPNATISFFGLDSPTLNVILAISPTQYISMERYGPDGYIDLRNKSEVEEEIVDPLNSMTTMNADEFIVINQKNFKEKWFV